MPSERLVCSVMGYSSIRPTHAMIRGLACETRAKKDYIALQKHRGSCGLTFMKDACYLSASSDL